MMNKKTLRKRGLALLLCLVMFVTLLPSFAFADLAKPHMTSASAGANGITVKWNAVSGASSYQVYRKTASGSWGRLATTGSTSYTDTSAKDGVLYYYTARCLDGSGNLVSGHESPGVSATWSSSVLSAPKMKSASSAGNGIKVTWIAVEGASKYQVYRKTEGGSWGRLAVATGISYTDTSAKNGTTYYYTVRCLNSSGNLVSGHESPGVSATFVPSGTPHMVSAAAGSNGIVVKWNAVSGASNYMVYRKTEGGSWGRLGTTTGTSYTDKNVKTNTLYYYTVRVCSADGSKLLSGHESPGVSAKFAGKAAVSSLSNGANGVTVKWNSVPGAAKYRVERKTGDGSWVNKGDKTGTSWVDTSVISGKGYTYRVKALDSSGKVVGTFDGNGKSITFYAAPTLVDATDTGTGIRVTWEAVEGISTYRVYRKIAPGSWMVQGDVSSLNYLDTNVPSGVEATYTVRCVQNGNLVSWYETPGVSAVSTGYSETFHDQPLLTGVSAVSGGIQVNWQAVEGVSKYAVYRRDTSKTSWTKIYTGSVTTVDGVCRYTDTTAVVGGKYSYTVACSDGSSDTSEKNETGLSVTYYGTPVMKKAENINGGVKVTWNPVDGVSTYRVYRKTGNGSWSVIANAVSGTSYTDATVQSTGTYRYAVSCVVNGAEMSSYDNTGVKITYYSTPKMISAAVSSANGITIKWNPVDGISTYRVYRKLGNGDYVKLVDVNGTSYTDNTAVSGKKNTYTIRCVRSGNYCSGFEAAGKSVNFLAAPALINANGGQVKWNAVSGATYYAVYRKTETGSWGRLGITAALTYTDKTAKSGVKYFYTVRVCNSDGSSMLSWYQTPGVSYTK